MDLPSRETVDTVLAIRAAIEAAFKKESLDNRTLGIALESMLDELMREITNIAQAAVDRP